ncbi:MAG: hypothetical protein JWM10_1078 [Myxococcaceae bacterium]|nr:hypothetical protein [Myxococcaceae bacterium]
MKNRNLPYWITTGLFALGLTLSGFSTLTHQPQMVAGFAHLGYPAYFMTILGIGKLLGVATLLAPGLPRLKEWAYAGFTINLVSAAASHLAVGDAASHTIAPVVLLAVLLASWSLRPASRMLAAPAAEPTVRAAAVATA